MVLSEEYAAGFIDGEGHITVAKTNATYKAQRKNPQYTLQVAVGNTYRPILDDLAATFGGKVYGKKLTVGGFAKKPQWSWDVRGSAAAECLRRIRPYLREKEQQAWLALEYWAQHSDGAQYGSAPLPPEELALRDGFYLAMKELRHAA